jgi:hypothetical protein
MSCAPRDFGACVSTQLLNSVPATPKTDTKVICPLRTYYLRCTRGVARTSMVGNPVSPWIQSTTHTGHRVSNVPEAR